MNGKWRHSQTKENSDKFSLADVLGSKQFSKQKGSDKRAQKFRKEEHQNRLKLGVSITDCPSCDEFLKSLMIKAKIVTPSDMETQGR